MACGDQQRRMQKSAARRQDDSWRIGFGHLRRWSGKQTFTHLFELSLTLFFGSIYLSAQVLKTGIVLADLPGMLYRSTELLFLTVIRSPGYKPSQGTSYRAVSFKSRPHLHYCKDLSSHQRSVSKVVALHSARPTHPQRME